MLSMKIQHVSQSLGILAGKLDAEGRSLLAVCRDVLADAADQAVDLENMPRIINLGTATKCKETRA